MPTTSITTGPDLTSPEVMPQRESVRGRWAGWIMLTGLAAAVPSGWLLAYLAALPFLLGLFFFILLGLMIGAVMFRVGSKAAEPSTRWLWLTGSTVAAAVILSSLWTEYRALPRSVEKRVRESYVGAFTPQMRGELRAGIRDFVASELHSQYPPGGFLGYLRWAGTSGQLDCPRILRGSTIDYSLSQRGAMWGLRVGLSLLMLQWTIMSQLLGLRAARREVEAEDPTEAASTQRPEQT